MEENILYRSKNPDLLFDDVMRYAVDEVTNFCVRYKEGDLPKELERVTVFVTHRCNFRCKYCNGPHMYPKRNKKKKMEMLSKNLLFNEFKRMLKDWKKHKVRHIHFSGGEPTLNKELQKMVKLATKNKILSSITTNGSANPSVYRKLIDNGMTEIRISIEASNEKDFNEISGVKGHFKKVIKSIKEIVEMRDKKGKDVFLVLNSCVGTINLKKIKQILKFLISLNPDDIKFLVIAMERGKVAKEYDKRIVEELNKMLKSFPKERFPLLRDKIAKLLDPNTIGLKDTKTQKVMKHCYIPATERTLDHTYYYPCSIYVRGYGKPIGRITESFEEQQRKTMKFIRFHNCRKDGICSRICTNCCKMFNISVNERIAKLKKIKLKEGTSQKEIKETEKYVKSLISSGDNKIRKTPFIIIKPCGINIKNKIMRFLKSKNIKIKSKKSFDNWQDLSKALYCWPLTKEEIIFTLEIGRALKRLEGNKAEALYLDKISLDKLKEIKYELRGLFPDKKRLLIVGDKKRMIRSTVLHSPDKEDIGRELKIIGNF